MNYTSHTNFDTSTHELVWGGQDERLSWQDPTEWRDAQLHCDWPIVVTIVSKLSVWLMDYTAWLTDHDWLMVSLMGKSTSQFIRELIYD